jgi:hypothetical protein
LKFHCDLAKACSRASFQGPDDALLWPQPQDAQQPADFVIM